MKKILLMISVAVLAFASCKKDNFERFNPSANGGFEHKTISASFTGLIVGQDEQGLEGVAVKVGSNTATTDENGIFFFKNISVQNSKVYFTAEKNGFFEGSRTLMAHDGHTHQVRIKMLDNSPIGSISNSSGGTITLLEGGQLTFEPGDVAYPNGAVYTGQVNVAAKRLDPTTNNGPYEMPGDLRGISSEDEEVSLVSYGMMAVELTDQSGNLLQVAPDQTVEMTFEIPTSLISSAKATIPMWYFDEDSGDWKEEGTATLSGTTFKGEVSHFTYWNCDYYGSRVYFEALFVDEQGNPMPNVWIHVGVSNGQGGHGFTDNNGWAGGQIPGNETVSLYFSILNANCNSAVFVMEFTTTNVDIDLGTITLSSIDAVNIDIKGTLVDCDDAPIANGYISSISNSWALSFVTPVDNDGKFNQSVVSCTSLPVIKVIGYDVDNYVQSEELNFDLSVTSDLGNIKACDIITDEYFIINTVSSLSGNDTTVTLTPPINFYVTLDSMTNEFLTWEISNFTQGYYSLWSLTEGVGVYPGFGNYDTNFGGGSFTCMLNVTSYPTTTGEYIIGTMESDGSTPFMTGSFRIKK